MKWKVYPEYKNTGFEWGKVPDHWDIKRNDSVLRITRENASTEWMSGQNVFHYSIPSVQEINDGQFDEGDNIDSSKTLITQTVLLVSKLNPRKGTIAVAYPRDVPTVCSSEFVSLAPFRCNVHYAEYVYKSEYVRQYLSSTVESATRSHQRANPEEIRKIWWAWPPLDEQRTISSFLDNETARIGALVTKKERQIELLQEKLAALSSHTVTKGLNHCRRTGLPCPNRYKVAFANL